MVDRLLKHCAAVFEVHPPRTPFDRRAALWLALVLGAGACVRFWGLGDVGLHGDEKTMALPTLHLVQHGTALMPSGMFYARALGQLYLMAASVMAFGQSEWALRLPSALCGVLLIGLAWTAGRRFLSPAWNLALAAAVAFLPDCIEDAQTARMYVFLVTSVAAYMTLLFAWERTDRSGYLLAAVMAMWVGLQFHTLAIFAAFLVFLPGLLSGDTRRLRQGATAFVAMVAGFYVINNWISHAYPQTVEADGGAVSNGPRAALVPHIWRIWFAAALAPVLAVGYWATARAGVRGAAVQRGVIALLLAGALLAQLDLRFHLAALLMVAGLVLARRQGYLAVPRMLVLLALSLLVAGAQAYYLHAHAAGSARQIAGLMLGWPSVWPFLTIGLSSPVAAALAAMGLIAGLWRLAHRQPVPDFLLLILLGVWLPLLIIGSMRWDIPPRYAQAQVMPLLIGAFATAQWFTQQVCARRAAPQARRPGPGAMRLAADTRAPGAGAGFAVAGAAALTCLLVINPMRMVHAIDAGYADHPDHKGAAEFVAAVHPGPRDILVAEDVLQQTYYLGHVDYWLVNKQVAAPFLHQVAGRWLDFYTNTPVLGTGSELERLLDRPGRGAIYIIGSGENWEDGRKLMRAFGISDALRRPQFKVVYRGRDGLTQVWKADAPGSAARWVAAQGR